MVSGGRGVPFERQQQGRQIDPGGVTGFHVAQEPSQSGKQQGVEVIPTSTTSITLNSIDCEDCFNRMVKP